MTLPFVLIAVCWAIASCLHIASLFIVARGMRAAMGPMARRKVPGRISVVRPINGIEHDVERCLESSFRLDDPDFELVFCAHSEADPAIRIVLGLMDRHPNVSAQLLIGNSEISRNPKLNNLAKSWEVISGTWVVFSDGNTILPPDYLAGHLAAWTNETGVVTTPPVGTDPSGFWSEVECAFLNQYQARWFLMTASLGTGFCNGKSMMVLRDQLQAGGGIRALASELAEDVALTKLTWSHGRKVTPVLRPVDQPLGYRSAAAVFDRQARWARIRRVGYTAEFACEVFSTSLFSVIMVGILANRLGWSVSAAIFAQALFWYGAELLFIRAVGLHASRWTVPASVMRDAAIPVIWSYAWFGRTFRWGNKIFKG